MGFEESKLAIMKIAFFAGIGFWSAKILLEGVVKEVISQLCNYKHRKEADKKYKEAMARVEESVAIARTTENKQGSVMTLKEKIDGLSCGTKGYKQLHEIVEELCLEYKAKFGKNSDDYWLQEGKEIFVAAMTLYLFEQKPAKERSSIRTTVYQLVNNDPEIEQYMRKFVEG